jgi:hypothetical protein
MSSRLFHRVITLLILLPSLSCSDILDKEATTDFYEDTIWRDINLANAYLGNCYDNIGGHPNFGLGMREDLLAANTDELLCNNRPSNMAFLKGTLKSDLLGYFGNSTYCGFLKWETLYQNIQRVNVFLSKIESVPCKTTSEEARKSQMIGEAFFIRAYDYAQLFFGYGGIILSEKPFSVDQDLTSINRSSLQRSRDFILSDIEKAIFYLPKKGYIDQGRATQGSAAALRSRLLIFCASKLVNGGYNATDTLVSFTEGTQIGRWREARDASKDLIDGTFGKYSLIGTTNDPPSPMTESDVKNFADNYTKIFNQKGVWIEETIWGIQYVALGGSQNKANLWNGPWGYHNWGNNLPTEQSVRSFEMADGSQFKWDQYNPGDQYLRTTSSEDLANDPLRNPYNGREPRFYSSILFHGAKWQPRPSDIARYDPEGIIQTGHFYYSNGKIKSYGLDTRLGLMSPYSSSGTGYYLRKFMDINIQGQNQNNSNTWIEFRYAEILLNYAEACIELSGDDIQKGLDALNQVRNRAGLPDRNTTDQNLAREYVRHERAIEFFAEGHRWYDIRRWMIAESVIKNVLEMKIKEYENGNMEWRLEPLSILDSRTFNIKNYWLPIPKTEIALMSQIRNNPGY